jgi:hypothetical protein
MGTVFYAAPLAAIPAVCRFIGMSLVGMTVPYVGTVRIGVFRGFSGAVLSFVFALVGVYIAALVIDKLAPTFQSSGFQAGTPVSRIGSTVPKARARTA